MSRLKLRRLVKGKLQQSRQEVMAAYTYKERGWEALGRCGVYSEDRVTGLGDMLDAMYGGDWCSSSVLGCPKHWNFNMLKLHITHELMDDFRVLF